MFMNTKMTRAVVLAAGCAVTIILVSGCSSTAAQAKPPRAPLDLFDDASDDAGVGRQAVSPHEPISQREAVARHEAVLPDEPPKRGTSFTQLEDVGTSTDTEPDIAGDPRHLYQSSVRSYEEDLLELADGSVVELMGDLAGFGTPSLDETFLLILGSVGEIWIEDHGTYACRVLAAPERFIEKLPFRECRLEKLIAGGRVILTEDRGVYEIKLSSQSILLEIEAGTPLWIAADRWVLDLGSVDVEALEVERHW